MKSNATCGGGRNWFEEHRDLFIRNMVAEFFSTYTSFVNLYEKYLTTGEVSFSKIDLLVGTEIDKGILWRLKDSCHQLWRAEESQHDVQGALLDWMMGLIFHEAMKLKENVYMCQFYGPLSNDVDGILQPGTAILFGLERKRFIEKTGHEIFRQLDELAVLFGQGCYLLRIMMPKQSQNSLLLRYLVEEENLINEMWSEDINELFSDMYDGFPENGYLFAARSYLEGHWYENALKSFKKALQLQPEASEARRQIIQLEKICADKI